MDLSQNASAKKQRNPKNQRDRKKVQEKEVESPNSSESFSSTAPQPQRANRRPRNEPVVNKISAESSPSVVTEKKEPVVNVVDHSNLKRETEEIAKLKKKFTKREITSNWHRYEAIGKDIETEEPEEEAPANFSELLQVPVSRGGHLQLKEEQDWSTATGSELSGYFALDLKLLSQSLGCIPLYERLRLPKHLLNEEEIKCFDDRVCEIKKSYNPEEIMDPSMDSSKLSNLVYIKNHFENVPNEETKMYNTEDSLNLLNVEGSKKEVMDVKSECWDKPLEQRFENIINDVNSQKNNIITDHNLNSKEEIKAVEISLGEQVNNSNLVNSNNSKSVNIEFPQSWEGNFSEKIDMKKSPEKELDNSFEKIEVKKSLEKELDKSYEKIETKESPEKELDNSSQKIYLEKISEKDLALSSDICESKPYENVEKINENSVSGNANILKAETKLIGTQSPINKTIIECNRKEKKETHNNDEQKDNTSKKNNNRKQPVKEVLNKSKDINLDEDDDLDFLLSLKKPVPAQNKKEVTPAAVKDSSFLPGGAVETQITTQDTHSELDDWLDSVLQD